MPAYGLRRRYQQLSTHDDGETYPDDDGKVKTRGPPTPYIVNKRVIVFCAFVLFSFLSVLGGVIAVSGSAQAFTWHYLMSNPPFAFLASIVVLAVGDAASYALWIGFLLDLASTATQYYMPDDFTRTIVSSFLFYTTVIRSCSGAIVLVATGGGSRVI